MTDAEIYESVRWDLTRYATALVGPDDAADVVSGAVTSVLRARGSLTNLREPRPYLMRAVLNEVRMRHRSAKRKPVVSLVQVPEPAVDPSHDHVIDLVLGLPPRQRSATYLVYYQQYTPSEAARLMGCRPSTVRRYLWLARAKLKETLDE